MEQFSAGGKKNPEVNVHRCKTSTDTQTNSRLALTTKQRLVPVTVSASTPQILLTKAVSQLVNSALHFQYFLLTLQGHFVIIRIVI